MQVEGPGLYDPASPLNISSNISPDLKLDPKRVWSPAALCGIDDANVAD
jgi:hypothetical protein